MLETMIVFFDGGVKRRGKPCGVWMNHNEKLASNNTRIITLTES